MVGALMIKLKGIPAELVAQLFADNGLELVHRTEGGVTASYAADIETGVPAEGSQILIDNCTVAQAKVYVKLALKKHASELYASKVEQLYGYSPSVYDINVWATKEAEAAEYKKWVDGGKKGVPPETGSMSGRITEANPLEDEVAAVLVNAAGMRSISGEIDTWVQGRKDLINSADTFNAVAAVDLYGGAVQ